MERLLQINIIGIHRRVLSPDEAPCAPGLLHFFPPSPVYPHFLSHHHDRHRRRYHPPATATTTINPQAAATRRRWRRRRCRRRHPLLAHIARRPTLVPTPTPTTDAIARQPPMRDTRGSACAHASSRFYYPRFLEFFQWRPALFHGLSLLYAYILPSEGSTAELYTLPPPFSIVPLAATLVLRVARSLATCACTGCVENPSFPLKSCLHMFRDREE